jgi:hypothetical protein
MKDENSSAEMVLPPEISAIVERMRGRLSAQSFLLTALKMLESGAVSDPKLHKPSGLDPSGNCNCRESDES